MATKDNRNVILLPIFPQYANAIMEGKKKVEFRKRNIPSHIKHVVVYSTAPEKMVIGTFEVDRITKATPKALWKKFNKIGFVEKEFLFDYYDNQDIGIAIHVGKTREIENPFPLSKIKKGLSAPQSFRYLQDDEWEKVQDLAECGPFRNESKTRV